MSVRGNAKSNRLRKAHHVESGGTGRKFMHLTRGDLCCGLRHSAEVSRGRSSDDALGNLGGAKDRRNSNATSTHRLSVWACRQTKPVTSQVALQYRQVPLRVQPSPLGGLPEGRLPRVCQVHTDRDSTLSDDER